MKHSSLIRIFIMLMVSLFTVWLAFPVPALAALNIISISPSTISNTQVNYITINGTDFQEGSIASLSNIGNLNTTYFSTTTLFTEVPLGLQAGLYSVSVTNPDTSTATLNNCLTITNQTLYPTATATQIPNGYERPVIVVLSYNTNLDRITTGSEFSLTVNLYNAGQHYATNVMALFTEGSLIPQGTGGVIAVGEIAPGNHASIIQPLIVSTDFWGTLATGNMTVAYTDQAGISYSELFTITIPLHYSYSPAATHTPTPTATPVLSQRPRLVIPEYQTSITPLQPGDQFTLELSVTNTGDTAAKGVTMIVGGGSVSSPGYGTPDTSGISGAGGEFTYFAPIGSSNIQPLGDLGVGATIHTSKTMIVNVSTNPGAYPIRISFAYVDEINNSYVDEQVITLLVYRQPNIEINFYQDPGPLYSNQPNILPLQIVNLGRTSVILGNLQINTLGGQFSNNSVFVGALETGGYYTLDATFIPDAPGTYELIASVDFLNDFNQSEVISRTITVDVLEIEYSEPGISEGSGSEAGPIPEQPETFLQKLWRFILGFIGLDSSPTPSDNGEVTPSFEEPVEEVVPIPLKGP